MRYPVLQQINARERRIVREFGVQIPGLGLELIAHPGAIVNGASVPRLLWWFASPWTGKYTPGTVFHDLLYSTCLLPKLESDFVFLDLMRQWEVYKPKRYVMYSAVIVGGRQHGGGKPEWLTVRRLTA